MNKYYKFLSKIIVVFLVSIFVFPNFVLAVDDSSFVWSKEDSTSLINATTTEENTTSSNSLNLESGGACLIEQNSGKVLYDHNMHEKLRPASVTKVMTILLIMEAIDSGKLSLDDKIPCSENATSMGGSQIWLDVRETLTVHEMLKAICVVSANDYDVQK